jgi:hypothetical protein
VFHSFSTMSRFNGSNGFNTHCAPTSNGLSAGTGGLSSA